MILTISPRSVWAITRRRPLVEIPKVTNRSSSQRGQRRRVGELRVGRRPNLVIDRHDKALGFRMVLNDEDWRRGWRIQSNVACFVDDLSSSKADRRAL